MPLLFPIHHTFAPLGDRKQRRLLLALSYQPWKLRRGPETKQLRTTLSTRFGGSAFLFASGREALLAFLRSQHWKKGDEVITQSYTCVVVPNAILAAGLTPIYADTDPSTLSIDMDALEASITHRTRAIIAQHTFGIPAPLADLRALCDKHGLLLIEDCAHVLPERLSSTSVGRLGDALLLSFGRDKAISGIAGGAIICRQEHCSDPLEREESHASDLSMSHILRLMEYPQIYGLARPLYGIGLGKILLWIAAKLGLLLPILSSAEKHGMMPHTLHRIPNICAALALEELNRLEAINHHRRLLTAFYLQASKKNGWHIPHGATADLPLQKFPLFFAKAEVIRQKLKAQNIHLHDGWTGCVLCPSSVDTAALGYHDGDDPDAETVGKQILCLPTHPLMTECLAGKLLKALEEATRE